MKMILTRIAMTCICISLVSSLGLSQIFDSSLTVTGSVDVYFRNNLNTSNDPVDEGTLAPATAFANDPGFSLGMANIVGSYEKGNVGFVADLVFGPRGEDAVFDSSPSSNILNQLFAYWSVSDKVKLTMGNFNTFLGYEIISPSENFNYSTSYMFSYGPFSHTGIKVDVDLGKCFSLMGGIFNPTDATEFNPTGDYLGGTQLGYSDDIVGAWINTLFDDDFFQVDITVGIQATDQFYVGLNATSASDNFNGVATYLQYAASDNLALGFRAEYFIDKAGLALENVSLDSDEEVFDITLSANYTIGNLKLIPEWRIDLYSNDNEILTESLNGPRSDKLTSIVFAAVYSF